MTNTITFKIFLEHEFSRMPSKAHESDSGYDLSSCEHVTIPSKQWRVVNTGLKFEIPNGYEIQIRPRSGLAAKKGITVNTVSPGYVKTAMMDKIAPDILAKIIEQIPAGRLALPAEIASMVSFLASETSAYITGANFAINGGLHMF